MSTYSLDEILELIIKWEKRLDSYYDLMEDFLVDERARKMAYILQERQKKALETLRGINIADYKDVEIIQNVPESHSEDLVPHFEIEADSTPKHVFEVILGYEEKLEEYYLHLKDVLVYQKSKDLLDMLLTLKVGQIKEIKGLMDSCDLAL